MSKPRPVATHVLADCATDGAAAELTFQPPLMEVASAQPADWTAMRTLSVPGAFQGHV